MSFIEAYACLLASHNNPPTRMILWGPGNNIAASEYNLDLFRSLTTTISGLEPGDRENESADIHYHPAFHRADYPRLLAAIKAFPTDSFLITSIDFIISGDQWLNIALNPSASVPFPAIGLLRWLHSDWNLSDVSPRIEALRRWSTRVSNMNNSNLKLIKT